MFFIKKFLINNRNKLKDSVEQKFLKIIQSLLSLFDCPWEFALFVNLNVSANVFDLFFLIDRLINLGLPSTNELIYAVNNSTLLLLHKFITQIRFNIRH